MSSFSELPLDLVPIILGYLEHPRYLTVACYVSREFYAYTLPYLYGRIMVYAWHKDSKGRVLKLFRTLSSSQRLASYVRRLEIRDFPKFIGSDSSYSLDAVTLGIRNCINLRACTWTRDGTLNSEILDSLSSCEFLADLEVNGNSDGRYSPDLLANFHRLQRLSVIMPSSSVITSLTRQFPANLKSLSVIGKASTVITDAVLELIAPHLAHLENLQLAGCTKVTDHGIWSVLSVNPNGLRSLGMEGLSQKFNMSALAQHCTQAKSFRLLKRITISFPNFGASKELDDMLSDLSDLLADAPLEVLHLYASGRYIPSAVSAAFWESIIATHGARLIRFSIHRLCLSMDQIHAICTRCTRLEELFITAEQDHMRQLTACLSLARHLRLVHINFPTRVQGDSVPVLTELEALEIVNQCPACITQLGGNTRVWQVGRDTSVAPDGVVSITRKLLRYEGTDIPEQFLVVKT